MGEGEDRDSVEPFTGGRRALDKQAAELLAELRGAVFGQPYDHHSGLIRRVDGLEKGQVEMHRELTETKQELQSFRSEVKTGTKVLVAALTFIWPTLTALAVILLTGQT